MALQLGVAELRLTRAFDPSSLLPLGEVLKTDTTLTHLDLSQVRLEDSAAYVVRARGLRRYPRSLHGSLRHSALPRPLCDAVGQVTLLFCTCA